jgi:ribosomal protein L33
MAWQKNKILLVSIEDMILQDGTTKKIYHRYVVNKSKAKGKPIKKLELRRYNPILRKHVIYKETKYK